MELEFYETSVSAVKAAPETAAWVFEPQPEKKWARDFEQSAPGRTQAFDAGLDLMPPKASGARSQSLPAARRLQHTSEFERVRREGQRLAKGCLILNWKTIEGRDFSRLGVVTSKKIGNAVARSRARRLIRESFRRHQGELLNPVDLVLVARPSIAGKSFSTVEGDFLAGLRQARLLGQQR